MVGGIIMNTLRNALRLVLIHCDVQVDAHLLLRTEVNVHGADVIILRQLPARSGVESVAELVRVKEHAAKQGGGRVPIPQAACCCAYR